MYKKLSSKKAVLQAIEEYDRLGAKEFLSKYGYRRAVRYRLLHKGNFYDSKAIVGVAYGYQFGKPLAPNDFGGGKATVAPKLHSLGFTVIADEIQGDNAPLPEESDVDGLWEGARQSVVVNKYERSSKARIACIEQHGSSCVVCGFNFSDVYGLDFMGFIHIHHLVPISSHGKSYEVSPKNDLRPVCANCHAIIHYGGKTRSVDEVKRLIAVRYSLTTRCRRDGIDRP